MSRWGVLLPSSRSRGTIPPIQVRPQERGYPPPGPGNGTPLSRSDPRTGDVPLPEQHSVYLLSGGWYASCVHAGGHSSYENFCSSQEMRDNLKELPKLRWQYVALEDNYLISYPASKICWSTFKPRHRYKYLISYPASKICWSTFKPRHRYKYLMSYLCFQDLLVHI